MVFFERSPFYDVLLNRCSKLKIFRNTINDKQKAHSLYFSLQNSKGKKKMLTISNKIKQKLFPSIFFRLYPSWSMLDQEREKKGYISQHSLKKNILAFIQPNFISNSILNLSPSISFMPRKKRKKEKKAKTHSSPLPSHHQTQSSPPLKKKIAQHRLVSTNDFLFDEDGIIIAESDCWHRFNASLRSRIRSERSTRGGKKGGQKRAADRCPTISNVTRNSQVTTSLSPPLPLSSRVHRLVARIHESVTLSLTKLAFTYASSIVRWVWKCPGHSGTMLSAVAVSARGGSNTTDTERLASLYIGPRQLPHYSRWPMANRIGRVPTPTLRGIVPRRRWPALRLEKLQLGIRRALESTYSNPSSPFADYICLLSFVSCDDAHPVWFFDRTRSAREFDTRRTSLKRYWKCLASKIFREETGKRNFGRGNLRSKFWQKNFISWSLSLSLGGELFSEQNERIKS